MGRRKVSEQIHCEHPNEPAKELYHYTECGLDDVYLVSGYDVDRDPEYGECVSVREADDLHKAIGMCLITSKKILNGKEVRFLRKEMDLTQAELGKLLGVTDQAVARWEKDKTEISGPADYLVRVLFAEHANGEDGFEARSLLTRLEEIDSLREDVRQIFEQSNGGWQPSALAA
jgi:DNA-binding transcriptional regulator YiaG